MSRWRALAAALLGVLVLLVPAGAHAFVAPGASIVSASDARQEQGDDDTTQMTLSADGRYAASKRARGTSSPTTIPTRPGSSGWAASSAAT